MRETVPDANAEQNIYDGHPSVRDTFGPGLTDGGDNRDDRHKEESDRRAGRERVP